MPTAAANCTALRAAKPENSGIEHDAEDFAHPVGAEVEAQHAVAVLHAAIVADHGGHDEFVGLPLRIGVGDRSLRVRERVLPCASMIAS